METRQGSIGRGMVSGMVATVVFSAVLVARQRKGKLGRPPPSRIVERSLKRVGARRAPRQLVEALTVAGHFAYGAGVGGLYSALRRRLASPSRLVDGMVFGALVWAGSYFGWVPALGLHPPAHRDRQDRQRSMLLAHLVYGGVLGALSARRTKTVTEPSPAPSTLV
jgi:hypothetical protein